MKNKIKFVLLAGSMAFASLFTAQIFASEEVLLDSDGSNNTYLGKSVDVVCAKNYGDIAKNSILSNNYYKNINYKINTGTSGSNTEYIYGNSSEEILAKINASYSKTSSINGLSVKGFTLGASNRFDIGVNGEYNSYYSKRYIECVGKIDTKSIYIENSNSKLKKEEFIDNLSDYFKSDLELLNSGLMTYPKFFNTYGTHLITNYTIGDRFYGDAVFASNEMVFNSSFDIGFKNSLGASFETLNIGAGTSNDLNAYLQFDYNSKKNGYTSKISCASGMVFFSGSMADSLNEWVQYTNQNKDKLTTIVGYDMDDLVPVWDLLPSEYEGIRTRMINEFLWYRMANEKNYYFEAATTNIQNSQSFERDGEKTINDKDRFNYFDDFILSDTYGYLVLADKYKTIKFKVSFDAKRKEQGYQYVYLYNRNDVNYKDTAHHNKFLWASGDMNLSTEWNAKSFEFEIPFSEIEGDQLAIVWRASGSGSDKWLNNNLKVEMTFVE